MSGQKGKYLNTQGFDYTSASNHIPRHRNLHRDQRTGSGSGSGSGSGEKTYSIQALTSVMTSFFSGLLHKLKVSEICLFNTLYRVCRKFIQPGHNWAHLYAPVHTCIHLYTPVHICIHLYTPGYTWTYTYTHLYTPSYTWTHLDTPHLIITRVPRNSKEPAAVKPKILFSTFYFQHSLGL